MHGSHKLGRYGVSMDDKSPARASLKSNVHNVSVVLALGGRIRGIRLTIHFYTPIQRLYCTKRHLQQLLAFLSSAASTSITELCMITLIEPYLYHR